MDELAAVESFLNVEQQLAAVVAELGGGASDGEETPRESSRDDGLASRLRRQLHLLFAAMPPDLQNSMLLSPERAQLLGKNAAA